jgi:transcriptional antiterminator RfaH
MKQNTDFWRESNWFAVQTKSHQESSASALVAKLRSEVFLPRVQGAHPGGSGVWKTTKTLFPGYFFARFSPIELLDAVRYTPGVLRVVGSGRIPVVVAPEIISSIRARIHPDGFIRLKSRGFQPGDQVTIEQGPLEGLMGRVERESDDQERVTILLAELLHARVSVAKECLRNAA